MVKCISKGEQLYYLVLLTKLNSYGRYRDLNMLNILRYIRQLQL